MQTTDIRNHYAAFRRMDAHPREHLELLRMDEEAPGLKTLCETLFAGRTPAGRHAAYERGIDDINLLITDNLSAMLDEEKRFTHMTHGAHRAMTDMHDQEENPRRRGPRPAFTNAIKAALTRPRADQIETILRTSHLAERAIQEMSMGRSIPGVPQPDDSTVQIDYYHGTFRRALDTAGESADRYLQTREHYTHEMARMMLTDATGLMARAIYDVACAALRKDHSPETIARIKTAQIYARRSAAFALRLRPGLSASLAGLTYRPAALNGPHPYLSLVKP